MFRMTLSALALAAAVALPATSHAQQASTDSTPSTSTVQPHRHHRMAHRLFKDVNLTKDERGQLKAIHQKYAPQFKTARQANDKTTVQSLRSKEVDEMRGVLTPDQQTTFDANRAAIRAHWKKQAPSTSTTPPASN